MALKKPSEFFKVNKISSINEEVKEISKDLQDDNLEEKISASFSNIDGVFSDIQRQLQESSDNKIKVVKDEIVKLYKVVDNIVENDIPKYKKHLSTTELRVESRIKNLKDELCEHLDCQVKSTRNKIEELYKETLDEELFSARKFVKDIYRSEIQIAVEKYVSTYSEDIVSLREELLSEIKKRPKTLVHIETKLEELSKKYRVLSENLNNIETNDPLLNTNPITLEQLKTHYQILVGRLQEQLASLGGGGEVRLEFLDDVDRNSAKVNGKFLKYDSSVGKWIGADASGGVSDIVDDLTPQLGGDLDLNGSDITGTGNINITGDARIAGILTVGTGSVTINGNDDSITIGNNLTITSSGNAEYSGVVTATSFSGDGSNLTGVITSLNGYATEAYVDLAVAGVNTFTGAATSITATQIVNWDTAYSWGDHSIAGYVTSISLVGYATEGYVDNAVSGVSTFSGDYADLTNKPTIPSDTGDLTNNVGFITAGSLVGYATETFVNNAVANLVDSAPSTLDTLNELASALGDDPNFATTITTSLGNKANLSGASFSGVVTATSFVGDGSNLTGLSTFSGDYADLTNKPTIPSDTGDLTNSVGFITTGSLVGYATEGYVDNAVVGFVTSGIVVGYATEGYVDNAVVGFVTSGIVVGYATEGYVDNAVSGVSTFSGDYNDLTNKPSLGDLSDVSSSTPSAGQVLKWSGSEWQPAADLTAAGGSGIGLTDLSVVANPAGINSLSYSNITGVFEFTPTSLVGYATEGYVDNAVVGFVTSGIVDGYATEVYVNSALVGYATETFVNNAVANLVDSAPATLDTLNELAAALGDDPNFATTITTSLGNKANLSGASFTGITTISQLNVTGISTLGVTTVTDLTAQQINVSGIVTANRFESSSTGTPTIDSPNNININAVNVAISTDLTVGRNLYTSDFNATGNAEVSGIVTATTFAGSLTGNSTTATSLQTARTFEITGDVVGHAVSFDGTGNVSIAATIQPDSVTLGQDTTGIYVASISGTSGEIEVSGSGNEESSVTIGLPEYVTVTGINASGVITATTFSGSGASLTSIPNGALNNSSVSYGGVSLSLGDSDATPAFDLSDATNYPYTSLTGITTEIVGDTTPQLGGNLDLNSNDITGTGDIDITGNVKSSGISTFQDDVNIGIGGTTAFFNVNTGFVGIGTDDPQTILHLEGSSPILRLEDTTDSQIDNGSVGKIEFYGNDGTNNGPNIRGFIQTISTSPLGNDHSLTFGLSGALNDAPSEILRLTSDGKVGIGTDDPKHTLHLKTTTGGTKLLLHTAAGLNNTITFREDQGDYFRILHEGTNATPGNLLKIQTATIGAQYIDAITFKQNGDIGVGTSTPESIFHIKGTTGQLIVEDTNGASSIKMKNVGTNSSDDGLGSFTFTNTGYSGVSGIAARTASNGSGAILQFLSGQSTEVMRLDGSGNLGIGTDNPTLKAHIFNTAAADAALIESTQNYSTLRFKSATNTSGPTVGIDGAGGLQLDQKDTSKYISFAIGSERLRINSHGGSEFSGIVTATQFVGDGSGLTNIVSTGVGVQVQNEGSPVGTAATINFTGSLIDATLSNGVATVSVSGVGTGTYAFTYGTLTGITTNYSVSGLIGNIKPTSASSKVMVTVTIPVYMNSSNVGQLQLMEIALTRYNGSQDIIQYSAYAGDWDAGISATARKDIGQTISFSYLDSPGSTSNQIYKIYARAQNTNGNYYTFAALDFANTGSLISKGGQMTLEERS